MNTRQFLGLDEALTLLRSIVDPIDAAPETIALNDAANRIVATTIHRADERAAVRGIGDGWLRGMQQ